MTRGGEDRYLIVNADDFGQSDGVNRGIVRAHEGGIVTSASLMVRWPAAEEAAACARTHLRLSVGLHLDSYRIFLSTSPHDVNNVHLERFCQDLVAEMV